MTYSSIFEFRVTLLPTFINELHSTNNNYSDYFFFEGPPDFKYSTKENYFHIENSLFMNDTLSCMRMVYIIFYN